MAPAKRGPDLKDRPHVSFTLSGPSSVASSRTSSPAPTPPASLREEYLLEKAVLDDPGSRPMDVYDATLPPWRAAVRRALVAQIRVESVLVAKMQVSIRRLFFGRSSAAVHGQRGVTCNGSSFSSYFLLVGRLPNSICLAFSGVLAPHARFPSVELTIVEICPPRLFDLLAEPQICGVQAPPTTIPSVLPFLAFPRD
ncbi:hypothetical protein B0H19DRAFT_679958 [Mycena capillaripes]|nr:hypothetical protein B0H19DRAFT_679958 [Mycena capillaripes]